MRWPGLISPRCSTTLNNVTNVQLVQETADAESSWPQIPGLVRDLTQEELTARLEAVILLDDCQTFVVAQSVNVKYVMLLQMLHELWPITNAADSDTIVTLQHIKDRVSYICRPVSSFLCLDKRNADAAMAMAVP